MENQHRKITGYRELDESEIAAMNYFKRLEAEILTTLSTCVVNGANPRWAAIAKTQLQQGFMAASRSIAKPGEDGN